MMEDVADPATKDWLEAIRLAGKRQQEWVERADKVVKRYRDTRKNQSQYSPKKFNILWSNTETLKPALYAQTPLPQVIRRFHDKDPVARQAVMILERALSYHLDAYNFDGTVKKAVQDYLLPGRCTVRVIYDPTYGDEITPKQPLMEMNGMYMAENGGIVGVESVEIGDDGPYLPGEPYRPVVYEMAKCKYVFWKDFRLGPSRCWEDMPWIAFRAFMGRDELVKRFGEEIGNKVNLDYRPEDMEEREMSKEEKKAEIWEIWDRNSKKVHWVSKSYMGGYLDSDDPPLDFIDFWPCPEPLYSIQTNDSMIPIPEYCQYQDQAEEIDTLTARIALLVKALRVSGAYAGEDESLQRILSEGSENMLIPVDGWAAFAERGGLRGMIEWLPIDQIMSVVVRLYEAREQTKQEVYEITGIADLIRGSSQAQETATAQRIKGQYATLRLSDRQKSIQKFVRDLLRLKAEVICEMFSGETLQMMTGLQVTQEVMDLLRSDATRSFRIDIETDSTLEPDQEMEKRNRVEALESISGFLGNMMPMAKDVPELMPLIGEMVLFGVRGFKAARQLEESIEEAIDAIKQKAQQAQQQPQQPDPKEIEAQAKAQQIQQNMQLDQAKFQNEAQIKQGEFGLKKQETELDMQIAAMKARMER